GKRFIQVHGIPQDQRISEIEWPCARTDAGEVWCWGRRRARNAKGKTTPCLDCAPEYFRTATRAELPLAKDLARSALVDRDGYVWAWFGSPALARFGAPGSMDRAFRLDVTGSDNEWVSYHLDSYCVGKSNNDVVCVGENGFGQFT